MENSKDVGIYCWDCDKYYLYSCIKGMKCPEGHDIGIENGN